MKMTVQKKYMCFILTLIMLVSGMCFDTIKADACFLSEKISNESNFNVSYRNRNTVTKQYAFVEEQSGKCELNRVSGGLGSQRETRIRSAVENIVPQMDLLPESVLHSYQEMIRHIEPENSICAVIIRYVHHQDGSKE